MIQKSGPRKMRLKFMVRGRKAPIPPARLRYLREIGDISNLDGTPVRCLLQPSGRHCP